MKGGVNYEENELGNNLQTDADVLVHLRNNGGLSRYRHVAIVHKKRHRRLRFQHLEDQSSYHGRTVM